MIKRLENGFPKDYSDEIKMKNKRKEYLNEKIENIIEKVPHVMAGVGLTLAGLCLIDQGIRAYTGENIPSHIQKLIVPLEPVINSIEYSFDVVALTPQEKWKKYGELEMQMNLKDEEINWYYNSLDNTVANNK